MRQRLGAPTPGHHFVVGGALAPGTVVGDGATVAVNVPISGYLRGRIRAKLAANDGTLAFKYVKPNALGEFAADGSSVHTTGNPANLSLPDTNEAARDIDDFYGEAYLRLEYTDAGGGSTIDHIVVSLL